MNPVHKFTEHDVTSAVTAWLENSVIGLNLCPFAKREWHHDRVRLKVCEAEQISPLRQALKAELAYLDEHPEIETSLLIHPRVLTEFADYNSFLARADALLHRLGYEGVYQIASFHPQYQFSGTEADDAANYSNRSPYPLLHILRETSLDEAIANYPDTANIPKQNIALMQQLGIEHLQAQLQAYLNISKQ